MAIGPSLSRKRKRNGNENLLVAKNPEEGAKKSRKSSSKVINDTSDGNRIDASIGSLDSHLIADLVARKIKEAGGDLSLIDIEAKYIPEKAFRDTSKWRQSRCLEHLPAFLEDFAPPVKTQNENSEALELKGAPHTLIITSAGLRAADVVRTLRPFQTENATVAKLFAKHIKLKDAVSYVQKTKISIGVGTPSRIIDLLESGALSSKSLRQVVIDCSHVDQKGRGLFDMREINVPLVSLLNRSELKERYTGKVGGIGLLFF
ncbi:MAG: hypothetical protein MMC33_008807 [Icmadophila ericetorum]|nr:hypothetical protein [Icmadophila ericetorum]